MAEPVRDLVVAGGGPAGLAVAIGAARAGLDVVVCEPRPGPIDKACGEGLMPGAVQALARLGVRPAGFAIRGIRYQDTRGHRADADFGTGHGLGVRRTVLHDALRAAADDAGVTVLERTVDDVHQRPDQVEAAGLRARYLVAADGPHYPIRAGLGLSARTHTPRRWGQRRHYRLAPTSDYVEVTWAAGAEAYVTPLADDLIGLAVLSGRRAPYPELLHCFPELAERVGDAEPASSVRGAGPLRQRARSQVTGRVLLAGDAAGYIDALTGEGLAVALASAAELVACVIDDAPGGYPAAWRRVSRRSRVITSALLQARRVPAVPRLIVPLAARTPALFTAAVGQLAR